MLGITFTKSYTLPRRLKFLDKPGDMMQQSTLCQHLVSLLLTLPLLLKKPGNTSPGFTNAQHPWISRNPGSLLLQFRQSNCVLDDPFLWLIAATLADFRAMLCKGNPWPSPGPDGWEKWCVKNFSDKVLQLVLDLHNYLVINASFLGDIKDTHLTYFHKHGICTYLSNWRGLLISNVLAYSPMTWLNFKLLPYAAQMGIIPETQVATQPGIQTHDLMSFHGGLKT
jgi:hypothetical protein